MTPVQRRLALSLLAACAIGPVAPADGQASRGALARDAFALTNVTLIPLSSDSLIAGATVVVRNGRITAAGPGRSIPVPKGVRRIDGRGRYLIPGLADMHVHLYSDDETPHSLGRVLGPQLWIASPQLTGLEDINSRRVRTPEEARSAVKDVADAGYDFVKLTLDIPPPVYDAIVSEAARNGIRVIGHVDPRVGVMRALAAGQHIEHLDNYLESVLADSAPMHGSVSDRGVFKPASWESIDYVDDAKVARIAGATARARVWTSPTLTLFKQAFGLGQSDAEIRPRPDWAMMPVKVRGATTALDRGTESAGKDHRRLGREDHGGSDTPEWFMGYGFTLHRELENLVAAGLTPHQALAAATRNPAEFLHALSEWGTIEPGKRADLVLLSADPLVDIRNTRRIEAVSIGGRWLERRALDRLVRRATERLRDGQAPRRGLSAGRSSVKALRT